MTYTELSSYLRQRVSLKESSLLLTDLQSDIKIVPFHSTFWNSLPTGNEYQGLSSIFKALLKYYLARNTFSDDYLYRKLEIADEQVEENNKFSYLMFLPHGTPKAKSVIFLLHGLNERSWDKYLPWAQRLVETTKSAVLLFPHAFHMNRAPNTWSNARLMNAIAHERKELFPDVQCSSFANAAISTRLQLVPARFFYSGLQTLQDLAQLATTIRQNRHPYIDSAAPIDIFGYSIGGFVGEILLMSNTQNMFGDSRLVMFCGGATLDRTFPTSRSILDSETSLTINQFYGMNFNQNMMSDDRFAEIFSKNAHEAAMFSLMIHSGLNAPVRRSHMLRIRNRIRALTLASDKVIPTANVALTLNNSSAMHPTLDMELHFPFPYSHEIPFPLSLKHQKSVDQSFDETFQLAAEFLT
ncbi:MAG TPA: DUF6051 family protein [Bacteroidota bacterium]|nr:DUF6051 family protein [Bacteroidota bacterium]